MWLAILRGLPNAGAIGRIRELVPGNNFFFLYHFDRCLQVIQCHQREKWSGHGRNTITTGFKRQLHIPVIILIPGVSMQVMHGQKMKKSNLLVFHFMFSIMLENNRQLYELAGFSG